MKKTPQEIERKFLIKSPPSDLDRYPCIIMAQGYIAYSEDGIEVRLRRQNDRYFQTVKKGGAQARMELEIELTQDQFETLWPATAGKRLRKYRYRIPLGARVIELDVYKGPLEGLITADVEFASIEQCRTFSPPDWFGPDISGHPEYRNRYMAQYGLGK